jgi:multidrug resistance efflux pump
MPEEIKSVEIEPPPQPGKLEKQAPANPIRRVTIIVLVLGVALFFYSLVADRLTPYTDQATVQAYVVRIAPDVNGRIVTVGIIDNQIVNTGDTLFEIDRERYEIAVETAEAQLAAAGLAVGASTAALAAAEAGLADSEANLANIQEQTARVFEMVKKGVYAKARSDQATASLQGAKAAVDRSKAGVEEARQNMGPQGADNPQIRQSQATLRKALRDLTDTVVRAPSDGVITGLQLATGQFAAAGQSVLTFVDSDVIWIESQFRENSLEHMSVGNLADVVLDLRPGRVYPGRIESVGWGVDSRDVDPVTGLPIIKNDSGWVRDAQRFAVRIQFDPDSRPKGIRLGSQASVVVYTGRSSITDTIGRAWIVLVSYMSYLG